MANQKHPTVYFDGVCNLCNSSIQWIIKRDPKAHFRFAALQSDAGVELRKRISSNGKIDLESVLLEEDGKVYDRSTAALRIARKLSGLWPLMYIFIIVPKFIRDAVYNFIGRNRYKWFGKQESCWVPTPDLKARFLDA